MSSWFAAVVTKNGSIEEIDAAIAVSVDRVNRYPSSIDAPCPRKFSVPPNEPPFLNNTMVDSEDEPREGSV
jgi:hypothetical protein